MWSWRQAFRKPAPAELDTELRFHLEQLVQEKISQGLPPDQARREAVLEFGGPELIKEEVRDVHRIPVLDALSTHLRYAFRALCATPSYSLTVIATLTLGIGANTAVFSAIDAVLLRPLPYPNPDRLVVLHEYRPKQKGPESPVAPPRLEDWNRLNSAFQAISGFYTEDTTDTTSGYYAEDAKDPAGPLPVKVKRAFVAPRFLQALGVSPALGHDFTSEDERFHGYEPGSVLVSDHYWREHFHSDPNAVGRPLLSGKSSAVVIGVLPAGFAFPAEDVQLWYVVPPDAPYARNRRNTWYTALGRIKPGVSQSQARANLNLVQGQLARQFPATDTDLTVEMQELKETTVGTARASLWLLFVAVSLLLLIACSNVSALVLARGMERAREFSVRASLGASRSTIVVQVLTETLLLAICGTVTGLALAAASARILTTMAKSIPRIGEVGLDWRLFLYTAGCAVVVTLLSGLFPAIRASSAAPAGALSRGGRTQVASRRPAQWILVSIQVALAVCLLSGAALLLRSFQALSQVSPGFDAAHVLAFRLTGGYGETADIPKLRQSINRILDALRNLPGVQAAASSPTLPGVPFGYPIQLASPDSASSPALGPEQTIRAESRNVSDGYFATMQIPVLAGGVCDNHSYGTSAVVNRSFVSTYFRDVDPIGRHLNVSPNPAGFLPSTILGVVGDARETGLNHEPVPTVYWCGAVLDPGRFYLLRTAGDPAALLNTVRQRVHSVEPDRAMYDLAPLPSHLNEAFGEERLRTLLLSLFAATALSLACIGLYGTMTYFVTTRRREIGLRIAVGARGYQVGLRFITRGLAVATAGVVAGLCIAAWAARFVSGMLYNVHPNDATALSVASVTMLSVALLASAIPAIRATRVDPMRILREE
jgi:putative ABC transport system permease protein